MASTVIVADQDGDYIDWQRSVYPIGVDCYAPAGIDRDLCRDRIHQDSVRLFSEHSGGFEIHWISEIGRVYPRTWFLVLLG